MFIFTCGSDDNLIKRKQTIEIFFGEKKNRTKRSRTWYLIFFCVNMGNSTSKSDGVSDGGSEVPDGKAKSNRGNLHTNGGHSNAIASASSAAMLKAENTISRSASGSDVTEKYFTQLVPIEKLSEILKEKSSTKCGINGIVEEVFVVS